MRSHSLKRTIDLLGASVGLVLGALPMALVALAVRRSLGPGVLFRQVRPGRHGQPFQVVKIRTMTDGTGPDDDRVTALGRLLRATSVDEWPQLWNVLRGEMSLVGPRPLLVEYLDLYDETQARRHQVKPGLTGLAQIESNRLDDWDDALALDVQYVDSWTIGGDLLIAARTPAVIRARVVEYRRRRTLSPVGSGTIR